VFVNAISNILTTISTDVTLTLHPLEDSKFIGYKMGDSPFAFFDGTDLRINLSMIQYDQSKDIVVRMKIPKLSYGSSYIQANLEYNVLNGSDIVKKTKEGSNWVDATHTLRADLMRTVDLATLEASAYISSSEETIRKFIAT